MATGSKTWGGARKGSGPKVRNIHLDNETTDMLRILSRQSGTPEQTIVANLIRREWEKLDSQFGPSPPSTTARKDEVMYPLQPLIRDKHGTVRFKANAIVRMLLDRGPFDMNSLATMQFSEEDQEQFAMLLGYSIGGFGELDYVSDEMCAAAEAAAEKVP